MYADIVNMFVGRKIAIDCTNCTDDEIKELCDTLTGELGESVGVRDIHSYANVEEYVMDKKSTWRYLIVSDATSRMADKYIVSMCNDGYLNRYDNNFEAISVASFLDAYKPSKNDVDISFLFE